MTDIRIGIVCEGPTDFTVIKAALGSILGARTFVPSLLQPDLDAMGGAGPNGSGWIGVQRWCQQNAPVTASLGGYDLVVIHVDADIADDARNDCVEPCPPAENTVNRVTELLVTWLTDAPNLLSHIAFFIPSKQTEAWIFALLRSGELAGVPNLECLDSTMLFQSNPWKLVQQSGKKNSARYREQEGRIRSAWETEPLALMKRFRRGVHWVLNGGNVA